MKKHYILEALQGYECSKVQDEMHEFINDEAYEERKRFKVAQLKLDNFFAKYDRKFMLR